MTAAIEVRDLHAWYGESHILHGVDITVNKGEVVTLLGRNGAGRTTTLRAIMGLTGERRGSIRINGMETVGQRTHRIAHHGIGYCPEERGIFASLSCEENLMLPPRLRGKGAGMGIGEIYEMFPNLAERRHRQHLLLDEISEGLAPVIVQALARMIRTLKARGYTVVMVEQNFRFAAPLADRLYVMEHGKIVESFGASQLQEKLPVLHELLGV